MTVEFALYGNHSGVHAIGSPVRIASAHNAIEADKRLDRKDALATENGYGERLRVTPALRENKFPYREHT